MRTKAQHYSILVVDIERFGSRDNPLQEWLRRRLYELVDAAFEQAGIDLSGGPRPSDRGDGFFRLLPTSVAKRDITGRFISELHHQLRENARLSSTEGALRLRVALHEGDVVEDGHGWVGAELNTACRLVDIKPLREALAKADRSGMALAVSESWYRQVVRHGYPEVEREAFVRVPFDAKEVHENAWIRVPGYDAPPGVTGDGPGEYGASLAAGRPGGDPSGTAPKPADPNGGAFSGAVFNAPVNQVFGGDQYVHGDLGFTRPEAGWRYADARDTEGGDR